GRAPGRPIPHRSRARRRQERDALCAALGSAAAPARKRRAVGAAAVPDPMDLCAISGPGRRRSCSSAADRPALAAGASMSGVCRPPRLSVVLPVYNGEPFLADALDSILTQDFRHFELIAI